MREREKWVDAVKGFAIYLVILGHSIQYATSQDYNYAGNTFFQIIYSFHMPLFMMMSISICLFYEQVFYKEWCVCEGKRDINSLYFMGNNYIFN